MSTISQISSYALFLSTSRNLAGGQNKVNDLTTQLSSGKQSTDLAHFGPETKRLLDLRSELAQRDSYINAIDTTAPRLKTYDKILTRLNDITSDMANNTALPWGPGAPRLSMPVDRDPKKMAVKVNNDLSTLKVPGTYTVSSVPTRDGNEGSFDITITDGVGGTSSTTLNLRQIPKDDGWRHNFKMSGGAGDGAVVSLDIDALTSASVSTFEASWPETASTRERIDATMREVRSLLNERFNDRYLFSGNRLGTPPVGDLAAVKQVSKVTFNGAVGDAGDVYSLTVEGRRFQYVTQGVAGTVPETSLDDIAENLVAQVKNANPPLPVTVEAQNGMITVTAKDVGQAVSVDADVRNAVAHVNRVANEGMLQAATTTQAQQNTLSFVGPRFDIGDRFSVTIGTGDKNQGTYIEFPFTVAITAQDLTDATYANPMNLVASKMAAQINAANPGPSVTAQVFPAGSGTLVLDATAVNTPFAAIANAGNGQVYNTAVVRTLAPGATSTTFPEVVEEPLVPTYDVDHARATPQPNAWVKANATISEDHNVTYGVVSTDPSFQRLITALHQARAAVDNPGDYAQHVARARELLTQAKDGLRTLQANNAVNQAALETAKTSHQEVMKDTATRLAALEGIDEAEVSARLKQSMTTLEATYTVIGRTSRLSLVNFLT